MENIDYLIEYLLNENQELNNLQVPSDLSDKKEFLRGLFNMRKPGYISDEFLSIQDEYLQEEIKSKKITSLNDLTEIKKDIYIFKGDITTLAVDGIVNACNSALLGCFFPNHACIDNAIHTYAGVQLRNRCSEMMKGSSEPTGQARLTLAYNLPSKAILHTVGLSLMES